MFKIFSRISTRGPSAPPTPSTNPKKNKNDDDSCSADDLTKDMDEPVPEPNIQEVPITRISTGTFTFYLPQVFVVFITLELRTDES